MTAVLVGTVFLLALLALGLFIDALFAHNQIAELTNELRLRNQARQMDPCTVDPAKVIDVLERRRRARGQ